MAAKSGPDAAIAWATSKVGITESPPGSNRGPQIDQWQRAFGMLAQPWCGAFVGMALREAGVPATPRIVYVPYIAADARAQRHGFAGAVAARDAKPGDVVCLFGNSHVELVVGNDPGRGVLRTIGGNTSPGNAGSQSNGGGVFRRERGYGQVSCIGRPAWPATRYVPHFDDLLAKEKEWARAYLWNYKRANPANLARRVQLKAKIKQQITKIKAEASKPGNGGWVRFRRGRRYQTLNAILSNPTRFYKQANV